MRQPCRTRGCHQGSIVMHAMKRLNTLGFFVIGCLGASAASFLVSNGLLILALYESQRSFSFAALLALYSNSAGSSV